VRGLPLSLTGWLRYDVVRRMLPASEGRLLEVGAGLGSMGALLADRFEYVGLEPDPTSFATASERVGTRGRVLNCAVEQLAPSERFDVLCAFEVLEHLEDDFGALSRWLDHVRPGGWVLVSVPLGRHRFGPQDEWVGHYRRCDKTDLKALLYRCGLSEIVLVSYGFPLGNALDAARNVLARRRGTTSSRGERTGASGRWLQPPAWASAVTRVFTSPFRMIQRPFAGTSWGIGLVARARLPMRSS
jgi:SAM-dependent methyltransferase